MAYADAYFKEFEALDRMHSQAQVFRSNVSEHTKKAVLAQQEAQIERLGQKYGLKKIVTKTNGILSNYRYEFADGSYREFNII